MTNAEPFVALAAGALTVASPCVLPVLPIIVGTTLHSDKRAPLALCAGLTLTFATLGALLALTSAWVGSLTTSLHWVAVVLLLSFGVLSAFPRVSAAVFGRLGLPNLAHTTQRRGLIGSFIIGTQLGLIWSPCAGPILAGILTLAAVNHNALASFGLLVCYGAGASIPMLALAYGGRRISTLTKALQQHAERVQRVGGVLVAVSAVAILLGWDARIEDLLSPIFPHISHGL